MLPVLIYDPQYAVRVRMLMHLNLYAKEHEFSFAVTENTSDPKEAEAAIRRLTEIGLCVLGIGNSTETAEQALALSRLAKEQNRDTYTVFWADSDTVWRKLLSDCIQPSGFVIDASTPTPMNRILDWIDMDYRMIVHSTERFLALVNGSKVYRIPISSIDYIEALDKKLLVWTNRQCISTYERLGKMEEILGNRFFRCHRSYLVQSDRIKNVNFDKMELQLLNGSRLPLSRSAKERMKTELLAEELPE